MDNNISQNETLTFKDNDKLGREEFANNLETLIEQELSFGEKGLVISLNGSFGSGKSYFLNMWKNKIIQDEELSAEMNELVKSTETNFKKLQFKQTIIINAWKEDFCNNPMLSIISAIVNNHKNNPKFVDKIKEFSKDAMWFLTGSLSGVLSQAVLVDIKGGLDYKAQKQHERIDSIDKIKGNLIDQHIARIQQLESFKSLLSNEFNKESPALILIDELDRCKPDYAVEYIETIKHLFDIPGIIFVIAIDRNHIKSTVKKLFGSGIDFENYYLKFVNFEVSMPEIDNLDFKNYINKRMSHFFNNNDKDRKTLFNIGNKDLIDNIVILMKNLPMQPRQIEHALRLLSYIFSVSFSLKENSTIKIDYIAGTIFMICIKLTRPNLYHNLAKGTAELDMLVKTLDLLVDDHNHFWKAFSIASSGIPYLDEANEQLNLGILYEDRSHLEIKINKFKERLDTRYSRETTNHFQHIYEKIESGSQFIKN